MERDDSADPPNQLLNLIHIIYADQIFSLRSENHIHMFFLFLQLGKISHYFIIRLSQLNVHSDSAKFQPNDLFCVFFIQRLDLFVQLLLSFRNIST